MRPPSRLGSLVVATLGVLLMAPTPGDTGGCGREATELDRDRYANARKGQDCDRCEECGLTTARCARACDPQKPADIALPQTCYPLLRDGEVCLRALGAASCETFATYVDDEAPVAPSECNFCRVAPEPPASTFGDGGATAEAGP
ncbi:MAG: hypothetical protein KF819_07740 [Labilithrix sp.]|nr:hypothetical protein [Labilithrix sp.]